ncbi:thermonuclease family protein [Mesorhizobium sp. B3-1-6]|uniref:thermonuclease family protein n=1 Tax=Mesorhizobium sp. B3-1-6 TaxID=2589895 RepID=UPI001FED9C38|nr:thermonuclease family protein [Mesorhizobium sp. B3-1-6]
MLIACLGSTHPAAAAPLVGVPSVVDGDTIEIHGERIRLNGIDAPESDQVCVDGAGKKYRCGQVAALALDDFLKANRPTSCIEVGRDRWRRMVAVCTANAVDIAEWLVRQGYALDWRKYSYGAYAQAQSEARAAKRGMWAGSFTAPWEVRHPKPRPAK